MKVRRVGKKDRLYSKDAIKFFGDSVSLEQLKELAPVLSKWRNRKCLKYDRIESVVNLQSEEHSSRGLRRILNDKGVAESAESCIATWLLGIVSLDELNRKKASVCLSKILLGTGDTSLERNWIQNRRLFWHSAFIAAFTSLSACIIVAITIRNDLCMCGVTVPIQDDSEILSIIGTFLAGLISISIPLLLMITLLTLVLLPFVAILTKILNRRKMDFIRSYSARSLGRIAHPLSSGALAQASLERNLLVSSSAKLALCDLLPTINAGSSASLPTKTIPDLSKLLLRINRASEVREKSGSPAEGGTVDNEQLSLAILHAFEYAGDSRALQAVVEVSGTGVSVEVRRRASSILPILEERARNETDKSFLLRGASNPIQTRELLRPVLAGSATDSKGLLRPSCVDENQARG